MKTRDQLTGIIFDDFVEQGADEEYERNAWTYICEEHAALVPKHALDINPGEGICGVEGCNKISDYYYDFDRED